MADLDPPRRASRRWGTVLGLSIGPFALFGCGPSSSPPSPPWAPLVCGGGDSVELTGLSKDVPDGVAVTASDGCRLTIKGGTLRGKIALRASGRAIVTIEGATIEGGDAAVDADASAKVTLTQCSIRGPAAVRAREQAWVVLEMGQAQGSAAAIEARGRALVDVKGSVVSGPMVRDPLARVVLER